MLLEGEEYYLAEIADLKEELKDAFEDKEKVIKRMQETIDTLTELCDEKENIILKLQKREMNW